VDPVNNSNATPLYLACFGGQFGMAQVLIGYGADGRISNSMGFSAVSVAPNRMTPAQLTQLFPRNTYPVKRVVDASMSFENVGEGITFSMYVEEADKLKMVGGRG
jgi:hypothetical protein